MSTKRLMENLQTYGDEPRALRRNQTYYLAEDVIEALLDMAEKAEVSRSAVVTALVRKAHAELMS